MIDLYKKLDLYFDEMPSVILTVTFVLMIVNGLIQLFVLMHKGWDSSFKSTLVITGIVTFLFFIFCFYLYSYGKSDSQILNPRVYLMPLFFFVFASLVLLGLNYGINLFLISSKTGTIAKKELLIWCSVYLGVPLAIASIHYVQLYKSQLATSQKVLFPLKLVKNDALPIHIREIKFIDSTNKEEASAELNEHNISSMQLADTKQTTRERLNSLNNEFYSESVLIPSGTDTILLSWYSLTDNKSYTDLLPIKLEKFNLQSNYYAMGDENLISPSLKPLKASTTILRFKNNGDIDLQTYLHGQRYILFYYSKIANESITDAQQQEIKEKYGLASYNEIQENLTHLNEQLQNASLAESRKFNWNISVDWGQKTPDHFRCTYLNYEFLAIEDEAVTVFKERPLPLEIEFYVSNKDQEDTNSLHLFIDSIRLFDILKALPDKEEITFNIKVDDSDHKVELYIVSKSLNILFSDFEQNIVTY